MPYLRGFFTTKSCQGWLLKPFVSFLWANGALAQEYHDYFKVIFL
jgi:hypothetical protein